MKLKEISQLFSLRDLRNAGLGMLVVFGGLGLSALTLYAHQSGNIKLATIAAGASLIFVLLILVFIVPPLARNAGREASQMNLPFEFTSGGAIILVLILIVGFSAWNTGNNLLFIVLSFLIATMVVGFFAGSICLRKLDIRMRFPDTIFAGEPTPLLVSITNRKRFFPAFSVVAEVRGRERERSIAAPDLDAILPKWAAARLGRAPVVRRTLDHFVHIGRNETSEVRSMHVFPNRGRLLIKDFELSTKFPFGFFRHRKRLSAKAAEIIVFPRIEEVDPGLENIAMDAGSHSAGKRGSGLDLLSLRNYQPHDDLRRIDWKATARTMHLTVREYADEDEKRITVVFDTRVAPDKMIPLREKLAAEQGGKSVVASARFEVGVMLAASILSRFADENAEIRLVVDGDGGEFGSGKSHLYDSLKRLALLEPNFADDSSAELETALALILNKADNDSRRLLISAGQGNGLSSETLQRIKVIGF